MQITILGSGSEGNATLFESGGTRVLVDAGLSLRQVRRRAEAARGAPLETLDAVIVTHAHSDHVAHAERIARAFDAPLFAQDATARARDLCACSRLEPEGQLRVGALSVRTVPVPHDAPQVALVIEDDEDCAGLVTDLGHVPSTLVDALTPCRTLLVESNHDPALLRTGPYPPALQTRIGGPRGHLSNAQAAALLARLGAAPLERVVLMHLSQKTNSPQLALDSAAGALAGRRVDLRAAPQHEPLALTSLPRRQLTLGFG